MSRIKVGVSLYSLQDQYLTKKMNLEDILHYVKECGAEGIEILPDQMLKGSPDLTDEQVADWNRMIGETGLQPVIADVFLNTNLYKNRTLTRRECIDLLIKEIKQANRLGIKLIRLVSMVPYWVIEPLLPYCQKYDVTIAIEVHAGMAFDVKATNDFMTIPSIGAIIGSFFAPALAKKIGTRNALMSTMILQAIGLIVMYMAPFDNLTMVLVGDWIFGIFNVGFAYSLSMVADSVDYMEWKTGVRTDGTAYATYGLATKFGNAFGGSIGVLLLAGFGYVANAEQTPQALAGINTVVNLIPAILFILSALACLLWNKSDKDMEALREEVKNRHSK